MPHRDVREPERAPRQDLLGRGGAVPEPDLPEPDVPEPVVPELEVLRGRRDIEDLLPSAQELLTPRPGARERPFEEQVGGDRGEGQSAELAVLLERGIEKLNEIQGVLEEIRDKVGPGKFGA